MPHLQIGRPTLFGSPRLFIQGVGSYLRMHHVMVARDRHNINNVLKNMAVQILRTESKNESNISKEIKKTGFNSGNSGFMH
jgi:hypothetical protein